MARTIADYRKTARNLSRIAPELKKYESRKRLNRAEKAYITRTANLVAKFRRQGQPLQPISANQERALRDKTALVQGPKGAPRLRAVVGGPGVDRVRVENGHLVYERKGRQYATREIDFTKDNASIARQIRSAQRQIRREIGTRRGLVEWRTWMNQGHTQPSETRPREADDDYIQSVIFELEAYMRDKFGTKVGSVMIGISGSRFNAG